MRKARRKNPDGKFNFHIFNVMARERKEMTCGENSKNSSALKHTINLLAQKISRIHAQLKPSSAVCWYECACVDILCCDLTWSIVEGTTVLSSVSNKTASREHTVTFSPSWNSKYLCKRSSIYRNKTQVVTFFLLLYVGHVTIVDLRVICRRSTAKTLYTTSGKKEKTV